MIKRLHIQRTEHPDLKVHGHGVIFYGTNYNCTDENCEREHVIVLDPWEWNSIGFLMDRVALLGSRIKQVEMPPDE